MSFLDIERIRVLRLGTSVGGREHLVPRDNALLLCFFYAIYIFIVNLNETHGMPSCVAE